MRVLTIEWTILNMNLVKQGFDYNIVLYNDSQEIFNLYRQKLGPYLEIQDELRG